MKRKEALVDMYKDGKVITRVFLGVNDEKSSRAIYGEHSYWRQFIKKKYFCLLKVVRELIEKYKQDLLEAWLYDKLYLLELWFMFLDF